LRKGQKSHHKFCLKNPNWQPCLLTESYETINHCPFMSVLPLFYYGKVLAFTIKIH